MFKCVWGKFYWKNKPLGKFACWGSENLFVVRRMFERNTEKKLANIRLEIAKSHQQKCYLVWDCFWVGFLLGFDYQPQTDSRQFRIRISSAGSRDGERTLWFCDVERGFHYTSPVELLGFTGGTSLRLNAKTLKRFCWKTTFLSGATNSTKGYPFKCFGITHLVEKFNSVTLSVHGPNWPWL